MQKLIGAGFILFILAALNSKAFAVSMNCSVTAGQIEDLQSVQISDDAVIINQTEVIALEHSRIRCKGARKDRFDGVGNRFQVILQSCVNNGALEGIVIDRVKSKAADVICD